MVKRGDTVKRGQVIAHAGQTGNVTSPQLHFEIRKGSTPVDPTQYRIKRVEERDDNGRRVVWVFLNCCGLGDIGVIDKASGEVVEFRQGAQ